MSTPFYIKLANNFVVMVSGLWLYSRLCRILIIIIDRNDEMRWNAWSVEKKCRWKLSFHKMQMPWISSSQIYSVTEELKLIFYLRASWASNVIHLRFHLCSANFLFKFLFFIFWIVTRNCIHVNPTTGKTRFNINFWISH